MSRPASLDEERVRYWLEKLGHRPRGKVEFELLRDGRSGAFTYRVRTDERTSDAALILKIVLAESHSEVLARGIREAQFYSLLADAVPLATLRSWVGVIYRTVHRLAVLTGVEFSSPRRQAELHELITRLFHWPGYLRHAPESVVRFHLLRVMELISALGFAA